MLSIDLCVCIDKEENVSDGSAGAGISRGRDLAAVNRDDSCARAVRNGRGAVSRAINDNNDFVWSIFGGASD